MNQNRRCNEHGNSSRYRVESQEFSCADQLFEHHYYSPLIQPFRTIESVKPLILFISQAQYL